MNETLKAAITVVVFIASWVASILLGGVGNNLGIVTSIAGSVIVTALHGNFKELFKGVYFTDDQGNKVLNRTPFLLFGTLITNLVIYFWALSEK